MGTNTETTEYTIDAKGKRLGRIASEVASVLLGKNTTISAKNQVVKVQVNIINVSLLDIPERKRQQKETRWYTG